MGGLSRKRLQPRIVAKRNKTQRKDQKKLNVSQVPHMFKDKWDPNATLTQNYKTLGLQLNVAPNMKHSKDG